MLCSGQAGIIPEKQVAAVSFLSAFQDLFQIHFLAEPWTATSAGEIFRHSLLFGLALCSTISFPFHVLHDHSMCQSQVDITMSCIPLPPFETVWDFQLGWLANIKWTKSSHVWKCKGKFADFDCDPKTLVFLKSTNVVTSLGHKKL